MHKSRSRKSFILALTSLLLILLLVLGTRFALANKGAHTVSQEASLDLPTRNHDDTVLDVGVEWINDFPGTADDRAFWSSSCDGLYNLLINDGWTSGFHWSDWNAFETDFKNEALGGEEDTMVDSVDIAMVCTHGSGTRDNFWNQDLSSVFFGTKHSDQHLSPGDAYKAYGDKDLEWLAFDSCGVLDDGGPAPYYNRGYWATTMNGLHLLLGFKTSMYVWSPGDGLLWGLYMKGLDPIWPSSTVMQAWFQAVDWVQPKVTCARVLAETPDNYNDHLWGHGYVSPDPMQDGAYWYWDHCSTGPASQQAFSSNSQPNVITMPVLQVVDRTVDQDFVFDTIAPAFNLSGAIDMNDMFYYMADTSGGITRTLQVDRTTGSYSYHNLSELWVTPIVTPTLPNQRDADSIINSWFAAHGEGLPAAWYRNAGYEYDIEDMVGESFIMSENGDFSGQQISRLPADVSMTYPRLISVATGTASGTQQVDFPIFGPGGRLKVYLGDQGEIIGVQGGSRDVQVTGEQVPLLDASAVWTMYLGNHNLSIPEVPWVADYITYTAAILGYYEMPYFQHQNEMIPVWDFTANFYSGGNLLAENVDVYVPAAADYMPPEVTILNPPDGATFWSGEPISFEGSITGGTPPYTIQWTSSSDGYMGNTIAIASGLGTEIKGGEVFNPTVSFQVTDANGLTSNATIALAIKPIFWIPIINK